ALQAAQLELNGLDGMIADLQQKSGRDNTTLINANQLRMLRKMVQGQ
ncbi:hypothetical protein A2U01_0094809, partial [Trifolium medium]|nr:hypothetical protein [Trifolium medium]